jgi:general stress protein 26
MATTREQILEFMHAHRMAVQASVANWSAPQAAAVGIVVTDAFEVFFDTLDTSRKVANLRTNSNVAFFIGPGRRSLSRRDSIRLVLPRSSPRAC